MKIKRLFIFVLIAAFFVIFTNSNVYASSSTASKKTFEVEGLEYVGDVSSSKAVSGSKHEYGNVALWSALYTEYNEDSDSKFYFLLVEAKVSSNIQSLNNGYYRMVNKKMEVNVKANYNKKGFSLIKYTPEVYGGFSVTETITYTLGLDHKKSLGTDANGNVSVGIELGISGQIQYSQSIYKDNIIMTPSSKDYGVTLQYNFNHVTNKKVNNTSPLRGDCFQRSVFIYELEDYKNNKQYENELNFEVNYSGYIQKVSCNIFGCIGHEVLTQPLQQKYSAFSELA